MVRLLIFWALIVLGLYPVTSFSQTAEDFKRLGFIKTAHGLYSEALVDLNHAITLNPDFDSVYVIRAYAKNNLKDYAGAIKDCNTAIKLNARFAAAYNFRGNAKYSLGDSRGAIQDFTTATELNSKFWNAFCNRAIAKMDVHDLKGAIQDCNEVISGDSEFAEAYMVRGKVRIQQGSKDEACLDFSKAGELGKSSAYDLIKTYCK